MPFLLPSPRVELDPGAPVLNESGGASVAITLLVNGEPVRTDAAALSPQDVAEIYAQPVTPGTTIEQSVGAATLAVLSRNGALRGARFPEDYIPALGWAPPAQG